MTDITWTLDSIAEAIGGRVVGNGATVIRGVTTDSRKVGDADLYVPVVGERHDGHTFLAEAIDAGAVAVVTEPGRTAVEPRIEVSDVSEALVDIAAKRRSELTIPVIAITGSTGKTSTKDLLNAAIAGSWASPRSYNNEVGVPLTVLGTPGDATALIIEVGSRGKGHIRWLNRCVQPDVSIVTNLGVVHLETFGSEAGLADAKFELIELLGGSGPAVVPVDEPRLQRESHDHYLTFGADSSADVLFHVENVDDGGRPEVTLTSVSGTYRTRLSMAGEHQAANAAAAFAAATAVGFDPTDVVEGMHRAQGSDWRMDVHRGVYTVVNDAYNANPQSVEAALTTTVGMGSRTIVVLGPMAELGPVCEREHRRIGAVARDLGVDEMIVVGVDHGYALGAGDLVSHVADLDEAAEAVRRMAGPGDVVLVKASRSAGLEQLAMRLIKEASP